MTRQKEDLRVKKTKKALSDAFIQLLTKKTFEEITVNELCEAAGVRRATFYKHYSDKFSFLAAYTRSLRDKFDITTWELGTDAPDTDYYVAYAKRIVGFVSENMTVFEKLVDSELLPSVIGIIVEQNCKDTRDRLKHSADAGMRLNVSIDSMASMCVGGVASVVYSWLKSGRTKSADSLAEEIGTMIRVLVGGTNQS